MNDLGFIRLILLIASSVAGVALAVEMWNRDVRVASLVLFSVALRDGIIVMLLSGSIYYQTVAPEYDSIVRAISTALLFIAQIVALLMSRKKILLENNRG